MNFSGPEIRQLSNLFNRDGFVFDFNYETLDEFTYISVGVKVIEKYRLSKGKSLIKFFSDTNVDFGKKIKLLKDLLDYVPEYIYSLEHTKYIDISYYIKDHDIDNCKKIYEKYSNNIFCDKDIDVSELGIKELLEEAKKFYLNDKQTALEKLWDAFERIKSFYTSKNVDKKKSTEKIIKKVGGGDCDIESLLNDEFRQLTNIGNDYRIRHHELNKKEIPNDSIYEYFYNRCYSLIVLTINFLS